MRFKKSMVNVRVNHHEGANNANNGKEEKMNLHPFRQMSKVLEAKLDYK